MEEIKEKVSDLLDDEETKKLWEEIYSRFLENGQKGIIEVIRERVNKIKSEFEDIKKAIKLNPKKEGINDEY